MQLAPESVFPLVVPTDAALSSYAGPITPPGLDAADAPHLWLSLTRVPTGAPTLRGAMLHCNKALSVLLAGQDALLLVRARGATRQSGHSAPNRPHLADRAGSPLSRTVPGSPPT